MARKIINRLSFLLNWLGQWPLLAIMLIMIVMVVLRKLNIPAVGFYELILIFAFFLYVAAWPYTGVEKRHIRVFMLLDRFPPRIRSFVDGITHLLSLGMCIVMVWASISYGYRLQLGGSIVSTMLKFPVSLLLYLMAFSFLLLGAVTLVALIDSLTSLRKKN